MSLLSYTRILTQETPLMDRIAIPTSLVAMITISQFQSVLTLLIAVVTLGTMIPRMFIAWADWRRQMQNRKDVEPPDAT